MSLFAPLIKQCLREGTSPAQIKAMALVLDALSEPTSNRAYEALVQAKTLGVDLRQVGSLALVTDNRAGADLLRDRFDIPVEQYLSTGEEGGMDCRPGYPLLAALAYADRPELQRRALEWGADPAVVWQVNHQPGDYQGNRKRFPTSWVAQVIRRGDVDLANELMMRAGPASHDEQYRRFSALLGLRIKIQAKDHHWLRPFLGMLEMLAPGGRHALEISPWDVHDGKACVAAQLVANLNSANTAFDYNKALEAMDPWLRATAIPQRGHHFSAVMSCLPLNRFDHCLPSWCVEQLTPSQAYVALNMALPHALSSWIESSAPFKPGDQRNDGQAVITSQLAAALKPFQDLFAIASSGDPEDGQVINPRQLLGRIEDKAFRSLEVAALDAIADMVPNMPESSDIRSDVGDLRDLLDRRAQFRGLARNATAINSAIRQQAKQDLEQTARQIEMLHGDYKLHATTTTRVARPRSPGRL